MRKGIQSDEEFRYRYDRILPANGSIPDRSIPQDAFTVETSFTRAAPEVRAIYHQRFADHRRQRYGGCGLLLAIAAVVTIGLALLAHML